MWERSVSGKEELCERERSVSGEEGLCECGRGV